MEEVNFKIVQGDTFTIQATYKNPDGSVIDLTDYSAQMDVRDKPGGKILCASATELNNGISIDGENGKINVEFTPSQTRKFTLPNSAYQLKITNNDTGQQTTLTQGYIQVSSAVIR
jgi:hypothetical protein